MIAFASLYTPDTVNEIIVILRLQSVADGLMALVIAPTHLIIPVLGRALDVSLEQEVANNRAFRFVVEVSTVGTVNLEDTFCIWDASWGSSASNTTQPSSREEGTCAERT